MFRRLLVPVDLSPKTSLALEAARELLAGRGDGSVVLLHVVETIEGVPFEELAEFYDDLERRAAEELEARREELARDGIPTRWEIAFGRRADQILERAGRDDVDLVVLSSHRVDPAAPAGSLGTLSHRIALLAPRPVLIAR